MLIAQLGLKDFSPKSQTLWHCSRLRSVQALHSYDWSWWYPSGNRPLQQYLGSTCRALFASPGFEHIDSLISKFKEGRNGWEIDVWAESPRLSPLWLSASSSACCVLTTVITPLPTKAQRDKTENWSWRTRQLSTCRCVSVMLLRSMCKIHEGVSWC